MDVPAPSDFDAAAIERAAREIGVHPGDPAYPLIAALSRDLVNRQRHDAELVRQFDQVMERAEQAASGQIAQNAAKLLPAEIDRRLAGHTASLNRAVLIVAPIAAMIVLLVGIGGGYVAGYHHGGADAISMVSDLRAALAEGAPGAAIWRNLVDWNDPVAAMAQCDAKSVIVEQGRKACMMPLWIEAPKPQPVQARR
jgi:hypothetical protein